MGRESGLWRVLPAVTRMEQAASALVVYQGKVLLARSRRTKQQWAFPGGRHEDGESLTETAVRELYEETGLRITVERELGHYVVGQPGSQFELLCVLATASTDQLKLEPTEILEAGWFTVEDALRLDILPQVRDALLKYAATQS